MLTVEWDLQEGANVAGYFKINLPINFPTKSQNIKVPITEPKGTKTNSVLLNIDENVLQTIISMPFIFNLYIPADIPPTVSQKSHGQRSQKLQEKYGDGHIQLDGHNILLPSQNTTSFQCHTNSFSKIKFTLSTETRIFTPQMLVKFTPLFIHLRKVESMPETPVSFADLTRDFAPVSFKVIINEKEEHSIVPQMHQTNHNLDVMIIKTPREQSEVIFEVHDRTKVLPKTQSYIGNGYLEPFVPRAKRKGLYLDPDLIIKPEPDIINPYGQCKFNVLPVRKNRLSISPVINHKCPVQAGNFHKFQTDLYFEIFDPASELKPEEIPSEPSSPQTSTTKKQGSSKLQNKSKQTLLPQAAPENFEVEYYRWILVATRDNQGENYAKMLDCVVKEHHKLLFDEQSESVLQTFNYENSAKTNPDIITGFHLITPKEHIIIIESRAKEPMLSFPKIFRFFQTSSNQSVKFLYDTNARFPSPRQYSTLSTLYQIMELPVNIVDLVKVEQLYFHNSIIYVLFEVVQKLANIIQAQDFKFVMDNEMFPTVPQLIQLLTKADSLPSYIKPVEELNFSRTNSSMSSRIPQTARVPSTSRVPRKTAASRMGPKSARTVQSSQLQRAPFSLYGKGPKTIGRPPNGRIAVSSNGDTEIWYTDHPEKLKEKGWEIEFIQPPHTSRGKRPKTDFLPFSPSY